MVAQYCKRWTHMLVINKHQKKREKQTNTNMYYKQMTKSKEESKIYRHKMMMINTKACHLIQYALGF